MPATADKRGGVRIVFGTNEGPFARDGGEDGGGSCPAMSIGKVRPRFGEVVIRECMGGSTGEGLERVAGTKIGKEGGRRPGDRCGGSLRRRL